MNLRKGTMTDLRRMFLFCILLLTPAVSHAQQVSVTPTVTPGGVTFTYSYSVFNGAPAELAVISFQTLARPDVVMNPTAPAGFLITFDPGNGFISFGQDTDPNTPQAFDSGSTVAPFTFTSAFSPVGTSFEAFDVNGDQYTGRTLVPGGAPVTGGVTPTAVPEPSAWLTSLIFGMGTLGLIAVRRRRLTARAIVCDRNVRPT